MNLSDAKAIRDRLSGRDIPSDEDFFYYTEAMEYLIEKDPNPHYMLELGAQYRYRKYFDLELKYYEMAASYGDETAMCGLGNFWYYGRNGIPDYQKAYEYYSSIPNDVWARCKIADMYKNGYYVSKNYQMYKDIIEELYKKVKDCTKIYDPIADVFSRLAEIRASSGQISEAIDLYTKAKDIWAKWIPNEPCWENIAFMHDIVDALYKLKKPDPRNIDIYDLFELMKKPVKVRFKYEHMNFTIEAKEEPEGIAIFFERKWYRTIEDFFNAVEIDGERIVTLRKEIYDFEVI